MKQSSSSLNAAALHTDPKSAGMALPEWGESSTRVPRGVVGPWMCRMGSGMTGSIASALRADPDGLPEASR